MEHDTFNPYTAVQRSPSQWFIYEPNNVPLDDFTVLTLSHDAVNLNSIPPTDSAESLESRYVVPEVIPYKSFSEIDTRSGGNPYSHHPNFTTPSQYFEHFGADVPAVDTTDQNLLTIMDIKNLQNPFQTIEMDEAPDFQINPPNDVTVNKTALSSESFEDLQKLCVTFPVKASSAPTPSLQTIFPDETVNKKMLSPESLYELEQTDAQFEEKEAVYSNSFVFREFSPQTLADLREIRNFSQYTDFPRSSKDVATCVGMSPSPYERHQFEWTENVAYGGV